MLVIILIWLSVRHNSRYDPSPVTTTPTSQFNYFKTSDFSLGFEGHLEYGQLEEVDLELYSMIELDQEHFNLDSNCGSMNFTLLPEGLEMVANFDCDQIEKQMCSARFACRYPNDCIIRDKLLICDETMDLYGLRVYLNTFELGKGGFVNYVES